MNQQEKQRGEHAEGACQSTSFALRKDTMESKPKAHLFAFAAMALFIFVFLGSEYHFDIAYSELAGPDLVVGAQASILATSAIGLVGYSLVNRMAVAKHRSILAGVLGTISALLLIATQLTQSASALLSLGCLLFLILGMLGNATYFSVAQTHYASSYLSRLVGASYAAGLLAQFLLHSLAPNSIVEAAIIGASIIVLGFALAARRNVLQVTPAESTLPKEDQRTTDERDALKEAILLLVCVSLIACVFSTLDNVVTLANAQGTFDLSAWPRLLLAVSGIATGFIFDLTRHRYSTVTMLCVAMLSLVSALAIQTGSEVLLGLIIFLPFVRLFRGLLHLVVLAHRHALRQSIALGRHGTRRQQRLCCTCGNTFHDIDFIGRHPAYLIDNHCASHGYPPCCPRARKRTSHGAA